MKAKRTEVDIDELEEAVENAIDYLTDKGIAIETVTWRGLVGYFDGESPSGDTTTLREVIHHR